MSAPTHERPCAAPPLLSYRYRGRYGWIMIGAHNDKDALREARRSVGGTVLPDFLDRWQGGPGGAGCYRNVYAERVEFYEAHGMTTSDAQGCADADFQQE